MQANNEMQASVDQVAIRTKSSSAEPQLKAQHSYVASANSSQANRASKQPIYGMTKSNSLDTQVSDAPLFELAPSRRLRKFVFVVILLIGMLVFVLSLSSLLYLPTFVSNKVSNVLVLRNNSLMLDRWSKPDAPMFFKVWMFDIQNPSELLQASAQANNQSAASAGAPRQARHVRPVLREVGPFVFRLRRVKDVVSISNETLYYTERKVYFFDEAASCCSINTTVTVPNIPLAAIVDRASNVNVPLVKRIVPRLVNRAVQSLREQVFVKRQVRELLFDGYDVELLKMVSLVGSLVGITPPNGQKFALFLGKNNTWRPDVDGVWALNTGAVDRKKFGRVSSWNAHKTLPFWPAPACNAINGSDGTLFPPPISTREPLYIFNPDLCRTVNMIYDRPSSVRSIPAYRFILNPANFAPSLAGASSTGVAQRRLDSQMRRAGGEQRTPLLRRARQRLDESLSNRLRANRLAAAVGGNDKQIDEQRRHVALTQQAVERRRDSFAKRHASDTPPPQLSTGALPAGAAQVLNPAVQSPAARSPSKPGPTSPGALSCFCERKNVELGGANVCEFDGIIDMSRCQKNAAVIFGSPPHFSRADPRLRRSVLGLAPNASLHTSYLDIEPVSDVSDARVLRPCQCATRRGSLLQAARSALQVAQLVLAFS